MHCTRWPQRGGADEAGAFTCFKAAANEVSDDRPRRQYFYNASLRPYIIIYLSYTLNEEMTAIHHLV